MKFQIIIGILFTLLAKRKVRARELAQKYDCSIRSVYRYVDELTVAGIPIDVARGANGGIYISDSYKLPKGLFTREEYDRTLGAMLAMQEQLSDPALSSAIEKLTSQYKTERTPMLAGDILVDSGSWGDTHRFSDKLSCIENAIRTQETLFLDYISREGEHTQRRVLPHLLVLKQNIWYVYAFCMLRKEFRLFKLGRIRSVLGTGEHFERLPFSREDLPLSFWQDEGNTLLVRFAIERAALPFAEEWLGIENIVRRDAGWIAEVALPDDESLVSKILSAGAGLTVLSPASLAEAVEKEAQRIAARYRA